MANIKFSQNPNYMYYSFGMNSDYNQIHQLLQKIQQAGGNREELKKLTVKVGLWGPQFFDVPKNSDSIGTPKYPNQFISISSDGEQASIILNIDYPDAVIAFSHWGDTIGEGYDAETISLKDFIFLIDSWIKEDNLRSEQGYKYINPQNRQDFQEYKIEVTKTTLAELLKKIRLLNNSN